MLKLNPGQAEMARRLQNFIEDPCSSVFVLEGYAGTGKTTAMASVLKAHGVIWLAPSHAAKYVLADSLESAGVWKPTVSTVSYALSESPGHTRVKGKGGSLVNLDVFHPPRDPATLMPDRDCANGLSYLRQFGDIIVVDEASMVSTAQCRALEYFAQHRPTIRYAAGDLKRDKTLAVKASFEGVCPAKIIYVGDPYQLKPVIGDAPMVDSDQLLYFTEEQARLYFLGRMKEVNGFYERTWRFDDDYDKTNVFVHHTPDAVLQQIVRAERPDLVEIGVRALAGARSSTIDYSLLPHHGPSTTCIKDHDTFLDACAQSFMADELTVLLVWRNAARVSALKSIRRTILTNQEPTISAVEAERIVRGDVPYIGEHMVFNKPYASGEVKWTNGSVVRVASEPVVIKVRLPGAGDVPDLVTHVLSFNVMRKEQQGQVLTSARSSDGAPSARAIARHREALYAIIDKLDAAELLEPLTQEELNLRKSAREAAVFARDLLADIDFAYVRTIHKAQGGTWDHVYVDHADVRGCKHRETRARLEYVALTRARHRITHT